MELSDDRNEFDLPLTGRQLRLLRQVRELGRERFAPRAGVYDRENRFPVENFDDLREAGLLALLIPAHYGGQGADYATYALVAAELGRHCGSTALAFNMHSCSMMWSGAVSDDLPLDDTVRARHHANRTGLYRLVLEHDALFAQPFSEPGTDLTSGREAFGAGARRVDGGWEVTGRKHFASLAGHATHYGILCSAVSDGGESPSLADTLYLAVAAGSPGFSVSGEWDVMGMRATMSRDLVMDQVFVPDQMEVMPAGQYFEAARHWPHIFMTLSPTFLGIAEAAVDFAAAYLQGRVEGGPRSGPPSATRALALAEIEMQVQAARALFLRSIGEARYRPTPGARMRAMICHRTLSQVAMDVTGEALRICGGRALFKRFPLERMHRDSRAGAVMLPWTADICLERVAEMRLRHPGPDRDDMHAPVAAGLSGVGGAGGVVGVVGVVGVGVDVGPEAGGGGPEAGPWRAGTAAASGPPLLDVRRGGPADLEDLVALGRRYRQAEGHRFDEPRTRAAFTGLLADDRWGEVLVGETAAAVAGYAVLTFGYSIESGGLEALLDEIYLDVRGQGLGSVLLDHVIERAGQRGARRLFLETEAANPRARAFYLRHRFTPDDSIWLSRWL